MEEIFNLVPILLDTSRGLRDLYPITLRFSKGLDRTFPLVLTPLLLPSPQSHIVNTPSDCNHIHHKGQLWLSLWTLPTWSSIRIRSL